MLQLPFVLKGIVKGIFPSLGFRVDLVNIWRIDGSENDDLRFPDALKLHCLSWKHCSWFLSCVELRYHIVEEAKDTHSIYLHFLCSRALLNSQPIGTSNFQLRFQVTPVSTFIWQKPHERPQARNAKMS